MNLRFSENMPQTCPLPPPSLSCRRRVRAPTTSPGGRPRPPNAFWILVRPSVHQSAKVVVTSTDPTAGNDAYAIQNTAGNDAATFTTVM